MHSHDVAKIASTTHWKLYNFTSRMYRYEACLTAASSYHYTSCCCYFFLFDEKKRTIHAKSCFLIVTRKLFEFSLMDESILCMISWGTNLLLYAFDAEPKAERDKSPWRTRADILTLNIGALLRKACSRPVQPDSLPYRKIRVISSEEFRANVEWFVEAIKRLHGFPVQRYHVYGDVRLRTILAGGNTWYEWASFRRLR